MFRDHWQLLSILFLTTIAYASSLWNGFVNLDDLLLVTENPRVVTASLANVLHVFTHFDPELYVPLTLLSYQLEAWIFGMDPWHFHFFSLLLHLGSVVLTYSIVAIVSKSKPIALAATALFALHPINSEAVFWISGRKDLLAGFFVLASLRAFLASKSFDRWYGVSIALTLLAMLSKISAVTLPLLILLAIVAQHGTISRRSMTRSIPFFALALTFGIIAIVGKSMIQRETVELVLMSFRMTGFVLEKFLLPINLSVVHSLDAIGILEPGFIASIGAVIALGALAWRTRRIIPLFGIGFTWFLLTLAPSFPQYEHGNQILYMGSERYAYLPSIGLSLVVTALFASPMFFNRLTAINRRLLSAIFIILLLTFAGRIILRSFDWRDSIAFNESILAMEPDDPIAHHNLAMALKEKGELTSAEEHFRSAIEGKPNLFDAHLNLGILLIETNRDEEGIQSLRRAVDARPGSFLGHFNLGVAYQHLKRYPEAADAYEESVVLEPKFADAHRNLAAIYGELGRFDKALREYEILMALDPAFAETIETLLNKTQ